MGIIRQELQKQIQQNDKMTVSEATGTILSYDKTNERCTIKYNNPVGEGVLYKENVPIANQNGGISSGSYHNGQSCIISFTNGNVYNPTIIGFEQSYYSQRTNTDQGAYIATDDVWNVGTPEHIVPMNSDWIDDSNTDSAKYHNELGMYMNTDVDNEAMELITTLDKYSDYEVGMTNLNNKSSVRLRDNGDIDIFTENNTGIRICKDGVIKLYGTDIKFTDSETTTTDKSMTKQTKVAQIMKICLAYDIIKETDEYVDYIQNHGSTTSEQKRKTLVDTVSDSTK